MGKLFCPYSLVGSYSRRGNGCVSF